MIHIHTFDPKYLMSTVLCNAHTIECLPPRLSLFIALHSAAGYYNMPTSRELSSTSQFFRGSATYHLDKFDLLSTNKEKINYACSILNKPNIFEV